MFVLLKFKMSNVKIKKQWSEERMVAAETYVKEDNGLEEVSRIYDMPVITTTINIVQ